MSEVMNVFVLSAFVLGIISVFLAVVFMFLSAGARYYDEAKQINKLSRIAGVLSLLAPFFYCLLSENDLLQEAISNTSGIYAVFASAWLAVLVLGVLLGLFEMTMKKRSEEKPKRTALFVFSLVMITLCSLLAWLFS